MTFFFRTQPVSFGQVSVQPKSTIDVSAVKTSSIVNSNSLTTSTSKTIAAATSVANNVTANAAGGVVRAVSTLVGSIPAASSLLVEGSKSSPKFAALKSISSVIRGIALQNPAAVNHVFPKFRPYESLTGLANLRPEIVASFGFESIVEGTNKIDASFKMTSAGVLLDSQVQLFALEHEAFKKLFSDLRSDPASSDILDTAKGQFLDEVARLQRHSNFIAQAIDMIENSVQFLDLRSSHMTPDFVKLLYDYFRNVSNDVAGIVSSDFGGSTSLASLLSNFGFDSNNVANFSSTKLYVQTLYELKKMLIGSSDVLLGTDVHAKQADSDSTSIIKTTITNVNRNIASSADIAFSDISNVTADTVPAVVNNVLPSISQISRFQAAGPDERVALLVQVLSREFAYSAMLADPSFVQFVQSNFGYTANSVGNQQMFDTIIGDPGTRIVERVVSSSPNSFMNMSQQAQADFLVLPFETDYIDFDDSVFSPGSVFYLQESLKLTDAGFNLGAMNTLRKSMEDQANRASGLFKQLVPSLRDQTAARTKMASALNDPATLFDLFVNSLVDTSTGELRSEFLTSHLPIVFDKAQQDPYVKTLLFMYFFVQAFGTTVDASFEFANNSPSTLEKLAREMSDRTGQTIPVQVPGLSGLISPRTEYVSALITELSGNSDLTRAIVAVIRSVYDEFNNTNLFSGKRSTLYSSMSDGTVLMLVFELIFSIMNKLNGKRATSFVAASTLSRTSPNQRTAPQIEVVNVPKQINTFIGSVASKLKSESSLVLKTSLAFLGIWDSLGNVLRNTISFLQQSTNVALMNEILGVVQNNDYLGMLVNEQQSNIIRNAVDDIESMIASSSEMTSKSDVNLLDQSILIRTEDRNDLVLLDDVLVPTNVKRALFAYFSDPRFSKENSFNARILSVGLPQGIKNYLKSRVNASQLDSRSLQQKEHDVIRLKVYRIDVMNPAIVFKPKTFLFELTRFASRDFSKYKDMSALPSKDEIVESVPFRDYSFVTGISNSQLQFGRDSILFTSPAYDFLTDVQKNEILTNHVESHFLDLYAKLLTGFVLDETHFLVDDEAKLVKSMQPIVVQKLVEDIVKTSFAIPKVTGNPATLSAASSLNNVLTATAAKISGKNRLTSVGISSTKNVVDVSGVVVRGNVVVAASKVRTNYSDADAEARRLFTPKMFDRIFNVFVDPDDFEIDVEETTKTDYGHSALNALLLAKRIVVEEGQNESLATDVQLTRPYKIAAKGLRDQTPTFDKFFTTIETILEEEV